MFKMILCIMLVTACGAAGILKAQSFSQRVTELADLRDTCRILKTEISYMKDPLPVIFERLGNSRDSFACGILRSCSELMKERHDMQESWCCGVDMAVRNSALTKEDKAVIYDLGNQLGKSNVRGQIDLLDMTNEKLAVQIKEAENLKKTKGKMYAGLGFSIGTVIAILLI